MTPTIPAPCAVHSERITYLHERQDRTDDSVQELRSDIANLRNWIMGAVLASALGLMGVIAQLVKR